METEILPIEFTDVFERIRRFLACENYVFRENVIVDINAGNLIIDTEIRLLSDKNVELLVAQMKKDPYNLYNILNHTPIIGFSHEGVRIADGNHRLAAVRLFNESQVEERRIHEFPISFYIESNIPLHHKLKLMSLAESKIYQNKMAFNKFEIMKHTRFLLLNSPGLLGVESAPINSSATEQKKYGERVVDAVSKFFHVGHPSLVLRNIWKAIRISDLHFERMYICFPNLPSGFDAHDFDIVFNRYILNPARITFLMTRNFNSLMELRRHLRCHVKPELIPALRHYNCYDGVEDHVAFIAGEEFLNTNGESNTECLIEEFLWSKIRYVRRFKKSQEKLNFLKRSFPDWVKMKEQNQLPERYAPYVNKRLEIIPPAQKVQSQNVENFIDQLVNSKRESLAAFVVHFFCRPQNPEQTLPPFYFKYLNNGNIDWTKIPRDDGTNDDISTNLNNFDQNILFK